MCPVESVKVSMAIQIRLISPVNVPLEISPIKKKHLVDETPGSFFITNVSWGEQQKYWANLDRLM